MLLELVELIAGLGTAVSRKKEERTKKRKGRKRREEEMELVGKEVEKKGEGSSGGDGWLGRGDEIQLGFSFLLWPVRGWEGRESCFGY